MRALRSGIRPSRGIPAPEPERAHPQVPRVLPPRRVDASAIEPHRAGSWDDSHCRQSGDVLLAGHWPPALFWKLPMTYAVPFIVAMIGALGAEKVANRSENLQPGGASAIRETEQR